MAKRERCIKCGGVRSKNVPGGLCWKCHDAELEAIRAENLKIVATGKCPKCGSGLRRNSALAGWWQCEWYGVESVRKDPSKPDCSFQCFV